MEDFKYLIFQVKLRIFPQFYSNSFLHCTHYQIGTCAFRKHGTISTINEFLFVLKTLVKQCFLLNFAS